MRLHHEVSDALFRHGVRRSDPLLVAFSAGGDSCALLHILLALGQRVGAAHVHHGLRGLAADQDLAFARGQARQLGIRFDWLRVDAASRDGRSPEARARKLRYAALERLRSGGGYRYLATAHSLDDQAETVLLRAARGTGPVGLSAILPCVGESGLVRPVLAVRRKQLRAYLRDRGLRWREDRSNRDLSIPRNRVRAEVVPALERVHPAAVRKLAALAELAQETLAWLRQSALQGLEGALVAGDGGVWLDPTALLSLPAPLRSYAVRELLVRVGLAERTSSVHIARVQAFLENGETGKTLSLPCDRTLFRDHDRVWLGPLPGPRFPAPFRLRLRPPAALELTECGVRLSWRRPEWGSRRPAPRDRMPLPRGTLGPLVARSPCRGDRLCVGSSARRVALADLFSRARWSRRARARAIVVESEHEILWVVGLTRPRELGNAERAAWDLVSEPLSAVSRSC